MRIKIEYCSEWYYAFRKFHEEAYHAHCSLFSQPVKIGPDSARRIANEALLHYGGTYLEALGDPPFCGTVIFEAEEEALSFLLKYGHSTH